MASDHLLANSRFTVEAADGALTLRARVRPPSEGRRFVLAIAASLGLVVVRLLAGNFSNDEKSPVVLLLNIFALVGSVIGCVILPLELDQLHHAHAHTRAARRSSLRPVESGMSMTNGKLDLAAAYRADPGAHVITIDGVARALEGARLFVADSGNHAIYLVFPDVAFELELGFERDRAMDLATQYAALFELPEPCIGVLTPSDSPDVAEWGPLGIFGMLVLNVVAPFSPAIFAIGFLLCVGLFLVVQRQDLKLHIAAMLRDDTARLGEMHVLLHEDKLRVAPTPDDADAE